MQENDIKNQDVVTEIEEKKICVLGLGYVGLTLAVTLADVGFEVFGYEVNPRIVGLLKGAKSHFYEVGIQRMLHYHVGQNLKIVDAIDEVNADVYIITVGTPVDKQTKLPKIDDLKRATGQVASRLKKGDLVVVRSTVPIGASRGIILPILEKETGLKIGEDFFLVCAPERTVEGKALRELRELPQLIGGYNKKSTDIAARMFRRTTHTIIDLGVLEGAEICKLMDNSYRDLLFGYTNQMALLAEKVGVDFNKLAKSANYGYDRNRIPLPSPGVGGACLSKDPHILAHVCEKIGVDNTIFSASRKINEEMPAHVVNRVKEKLTGLGKNLDNAKVFILGFAFKGKPETSDMRDSPTIDLVEILKQSNCELVGMDPLVSREEIEGLGVKVVSVEEGFKGADVVIIMTNHPAFSDLDLPELFKTVNTPFVFFDGWQIFDPNYVSSHPGIVSLGVGYG